MRVVIFCDMEGIACIENWEQVEGGKPLYEQARKLYTDEMNAAVRGARAAGAAHIDVVDCHGAGGSYSFRSFLVDRLVLQPHLGSQASCPSFDMEAFGSGLMSPAPVRPV